MSRESFLIGYPKDKPYDIENFEIITYGSRSKVSKAFKKEKGNGISDKWSMIKVIGTMSRRSFHFSEGKPKEELSLIDQYLKDKKITPAAAELAKENDVDVSLINPGQDKKIGKPEVQAFIDEGSE